MKRSFALLAACLALLALLVCVGCADRDDDSVAMQLLADRSAAAKDFADPLFTEHMAALGMNDHTIEQSAYGFSTADIDDQVYFVAYRYCAGDADGVYGYRVMIDDHGICRLLEEGADVAHFIWPEQ